MLPYRKSFTEKEYHANSSVDSIDPRSIVLHLLYRRVSSITMKKSSLNLRIVDAAEPLRKIFGNLYFMGTNLSEPDYRFEVDTPAGGTITFNAQATAEYIMLHCQGWETSDFNPDNEETS